MKLTVPNPESHDTGNSQRRDELPGATAGFASFYNVLRIPGNRLRARKPFEMDNAHSGNGASANAGACADTEMLVLLHFTTFLKDFRKPFAGKETVCGGQGSQWNRCQSKHGNLHFSNDFQ